jgi:hypothetical protein
VHSLSTVGAKFEVTLFEASWHAPNLRCFQEFSLVQNTTRSGATESSRLHHSDIGQLLGRPLARALRRHEQRHPGCHYPKEQGAKQHPRDEPSVVLSSTASTFIGRCPSRRLAALAAPGTGLAGGSAAGAD